MSEGVDSIPTFTQLRKGIDWHAVGQPGEPAFYSNWSNVGGSYMPVAFGYDPYASGMIWLRGCLKQSGGAVSMFILPVGYRPQQTEVFLSGMGNSYVSIVIQASGLLYIASVAGGGTSNCQVSLSGIAFEPANPL